MCDVTGTAALLERLATAADVDALDGAVLCDVIGRVLGVARQTGGLARALDARGGGVAGAAVVERHVEAPRSRVDEVRAHVDRALELEPERYVAAGAGAAVRARVQHLVERALAAVARVAGRFQRRRG